ncbi:2-oxo-hepta-3-ene-1,7-dioic acid hydratase [Comamonas serinivorans]|uniref:2-oxo-hepta-3-ene-1,7-dioic acid hydratase n=1 Tax=Comamonas serinivorans TaxID=1082851 RepID=A0A1Y0ESB4_9BURK|nr:fumarylacetoacetate hydrolase family protein [Comamonas serinivorans]ARU06547.1 2-oxo-hepta-3-ene-1,7-dioic acid hydratase [Comamonas serinivorans]
MLPKEQITSLAAQLQHAQQTRTPMAQLSAQWPDLTVDEAYAISRAWGTLRHDEGRSLRGYKIAMTSRATQAMYGASEPAIGWLYDDMVFDNGSSLPADRFIAANVELELAFIIGKPLQGPRVTAFDVLAATDCIVPSFEIVDARVQQLHPQTKAPRTLVDLVSDNSVAAGAMLGGHPTRPTELNLPWVGAMLYKNGAIEDTGLAATVMSHPAKSVAWLANRLSQWGEKLEPGQIVLSGTLIRPVPVRAGDVMQGDFGPLGQVAWRLV